MLHPTYRKAPKYIKETTLNVEDLNSITTNLCLPKHHTHQMGQNRWEEIFICIYGDSSILLSAALYGVLLWCDMSL